MYINKNKALSFIDAPFPRVLLLPARTPPPLFLQEQRRPPFSGVCRQAHPAPWPPDARCSCLGQTGILLFADRLQPLGAAALTGDFHGQMHEPAVPGRAVPVLDPGGDVDHVARVQFACGLTSRARRCRAVSARRRWRPHGYASCCGIPVRRSRYR